MTPKTEQKKSQLAWSPEERARLIHFRGQNPDMTWPEFHKRYPFPNRTPASVLQCYHRLINPEGAEIRRKRKRNDNGTENTTERSRCEFTEWEQVSMHDEDDGGDGGDGGNAGDEGDGRDQGEKGDQDEVADIEEMEDEESTDDKARDIGFNGTVGSVKCGSPCKNDFIRRISNSKHTAAERKPPIPYIPKEPSRGAGINPQFVAARTIHAIDPAPRAHLGVSNSMRLHPLEGHVHGMLRERRAAGSEANTHLEGLETLRSRFDSIESAAMQTQEEIRETKEDMKKLQEDIRKVQEQAIKDRKAIAGVVSLLGNLRIVDLFRMTGGSGGDDLKVEPASDLAGGSEGLFTRTPECDSVSEQLRPSSG